MKSRLPYKKSWIVLGLLLVAATSCAMLVLGDRGLLELYRLRCESALLERGNSGLREDNAELARRAKALQSDKAEIERLARERLGMIKDGEVVYYLPQKGEGTPAAEGQGGPAAGRQDAPETVATRP